VRFAIKRTSLFFVPKQYVVSAALYSSFTPSLSIPFCHPSSGIDFIASKTDSLWSAVMVKPIDSLLQ